jgi:hypothetical protein
VGDADPAVTGVTGIRHGSGSPGHQVRLKYSDNECDDMDARAGSVAIATLEDKEISFVAGVVCC